MLDEELEQGRFIIGSPEDCLEQLLPWRDRPGVDHFIFRTDWIGLPADIVGAIDFLASPRAGFITGQVLTIDGGA